MDSHRDFPLPLHPTSMEPDPSTIADAWGCGEVEPSDLLALWPVGRGEAAPTLDQVMALFEQHLADKPIVRDSNPPIHDSHVKWSAVLDLPGQRTAMLWCEPMRELSAEHIAFLKAQGVKWVIGAETVLDPAHPLDDFVALLTMLSRGIPDSPAILNVNTEGWHTRQELDEVIFAHGIGPGMSILWVVHATAASADPDAIAWLYTCGLARCGRPELEMLGIPVANARQAGMLLSGIAELMMETGLPEPGGSMEIGHDLEVSFQQWRDVAATITPSAMGSINHRTMHSGEKLERASAAICAADTLDGRKSWPAEVLERLAGEEATPIYQTRHATQRKARLARATWDDLGRAHMALVENAARSNRINSTSSHMQPSFAIKAGFERPGVELDGSPLDREHLWFDALRFDGQRVQGKLVNQPMFVPGLRRNDVRWIQREQLSDWRVSVPQVQASFGPEHVKQLRQAIFALKSMP